MRLNPIPINKDVNLRDTKWVVVCPNCQCERIITYAQTWNINSKKSHQECRDCRIELGIQKIKTNHLINYINNSNVQEKATLKRTGLKRNKEKTAILYHNLFNPEFNNNSDVKEKQRKAKLGKFGKEANAWDGGKTKERNLALSRDDYKQLRKRCFERDDFICQICSKRGGQLEMDHIKEWCNYPELRYELSNVRTLCHFCHVKTDNYLHKAKRKI